MARVAVAVDGDWFSAERSPVGDQNNKYMRSRLEEESPDIRWTFLQTPPPNHMRKTNKNQLNITGEILRASINKSFVGTISGRKEEIKEAEFDYDDFLPPVQEEPIPKPSHHKRINFSQFKDTPTSKIFKITQSRLQNIPEEKSPHSSVIQEDPLGEEVQVEIEDPFYISSFTNKDKDLVYDPSCLCGKPFKKQCKLVLSNESTLQVLVKEGEQEKMQFNTLLLAINFDTVKAEVSYAQRLNEKELKIEVGDITLVVYHDKADIVETYYKHIESMRKQCKGYELNLDRLLQKDQFYKQRYETEQFFSKYSQTGDILLFEDTHFFAKAQRFFTRSDFDHVAMVIKDNNYGLMMFESMSSGVSLTPWRSVIKYGWFQNIPRQAECQSRIVWRRLQVERDAAFYSTVQKFVMENIEKSYHISFAKLTAQQSMIQSPSTVNKDGAGGKEEEEGGFFCSELVATLYKELGLLTRDTNNPNYQPACTFYPKDFSARSGKKLDQGELSPEYDIFFDLKLLALNYKFTKVK